MTTKGPSRKQVIILISSNNVEWVIAKSNTYIANIDRPLKEIKSANYIWSNNKGIIITTSKVMAELSSSQIVDLVSLYFIFHFYFHSVLLFYFLFLEQLGLGLISHAVTLVTTWWGGHKTDYETWENLVENSRTDDVIQHGHQLASWTTHGCLG